MKRNENGQALLELAVSITVLFIMVAGVVDLGRMLFHYIAMRDAAQEAAAYGSINPTHCDQIRERAWIAMASSPFVTVTTTIDGIDCTAAASNPSKACYGKEIRVSLSDPEFPITMPFIGTFLGRQTVSLEAHITGTILRPACQ
ncbi:MAG TPA: TadE family protein [Levilinea sp.]|nr:TadE family protein [Levilinea sp.]